MTIRGIQRGQQVIPGIQPTDASTDAQASDGAVTDFSALLSQMASQVGTSTSDSAGVALIKTLNATAANRQDTKAPEPTRPRPERDRPERAEPASRSGKRLTVPTPVRQRMTRLPQLLMLLIPHRKPIRLRLMPPWRRLWRRWLSPPRW